MPENDLIANSFTTDRRKEFPDWPDWALVHLHVGTFFFDSSNAGEGVPPYIWFVRLNKTPENEAALAKAPGEFYEPEFVIDPNTGRANTDDRFLEIRVGAGAAWAIWQPILEHLNPFGGLGLPSSTAAGEEEGRKSAQELLDGLKQAQHDARRRTQLARLRAFGHIGGHEVFPHINPKTAEITYTDSFPNLQRR